MDDQKTKKQQLVSDEPKKIGQSKNDQVLKQEVESLKKQLEESQKVSQEYKVKYLRALADYQNFEKRVAGDKEMLLKTANAGLILRLLPFLDSLDKAEVFVKDEGLKIVKIQFHKTLQDIGLEEMDVLNKDFDPYTAEVVDMVEGEKDNIVVEILRKGYKFHGNILRVAQVKVSKKPIKN